MLRLDSKTKSKEQTRMSSNTDGYIANALTIDVISEIEKELMDSPYDMISLVFLLYEVPDTALQRLVLYQHNCNDIYSTKMNLIYEWMVQAKTKPTWRQEFLEALLICQLYGIVRKLGFNIESEIRHYQPDDIYFTKYVNPIKKALYKLCEKIDIHNLNTLKRSLQTFQIDTLEYGSCELIFLKLMSEKIITLTDTHLEFKSFGNKFNFEKLLKLLQKLPDSEYFDSELRLLENPTNKVLIGHPAATSSPIISQMSDIPLASQQNNIEQRYAGLDDMKSMLDSLGQVNFDEINMKPDSNKIKMDTYQIKDPNEIGLCIIINQEEFHLCEQSLEDQYLKTSLLRRTGSTFDRIALEKTMKELKFNVLTKNNLDHIEMLSFIKESVKKHVKDSTSIFMLCILSHGVRDHVFAADCVKIKVEDIQKLLDSEEALCLRGIPKVLIIQACQSDDTPQYTLVADSPTPKGFYIGKSDFLVYWATSPEYEAFRSEEEGSIFIQCLCEVITDHGYKEHLLDIFTTNTRKVYSCCSKHKKYQVPLMKTSLMKKLYLNKF